MSLDQAQWIEKIGSIFFPYLQKQQKSINANNTRFVHYTSAQAAMNILKTKEVWMRESSCMNDFMEVQHGFQCVLDAYRSECGKKFQGVLNSVFPDVSVEIEKHFNSWWPHLEKDTYFTCVSEHDDREDTTGRLSMWRAYSGTTGVAIVMNQAPFLGESQALNAYTSPVAYLSNNDFKLQFAEVTENIARELETIKILDKAYIINIVFEMLKLAAVSTKHPGFREEREWRVVYFPKQNQSKHIQYGVEVINGAPQPVYKIPLKNIPDEGLLGIEIPELIERIIIGPTQYPSAIQKAFVSLLADAGDKKAASKVWVSNIPLRQ